MPKVAQIWLFSKIFRREKLWYIVKFVLQSIQSGISGLRVKKCRALFLGKSWNEDKPARQKAFNIIILGFTWAFNRQIISNFWLKPAAAGLFSSGFLARAGEIECWHDFRSDGTRQKISRRAETRQENSRRDRELAKKVSRQTETEIFVLRQNRDTIFLSKFPKKYF